MDFRRKQSHPLKLLRLYREGVKGREQDLVWFIEREVQFANFVVGRGFGEASFAGSAVGYGHDGGFINRHRLFDLGCKFEGRRHKRQHIEVGAATGPKHLAAFVGHDFDEADPRFDI